MNQSSLTLPSFAKINLSLRVLGKRLDGYHQVATVLQTISLHDDLSFQLSDKSGVVLRSNDTTLPADQSNLIVRAAVAFKRESGIGFGVTIGLRKTIPVGAGLGGGSSNAAMTLLALNRLWNVNAPIRTLEGIGASLGADVPFFFTGGRAIATGTGTEISPVSDLPLKQLIIITPRASISTANAYKALDAASLTTSGTLPILTSSSAEPILSDCDQWPLQNDFESVIFEIEPEITRARGAMIDAGARQVMLSGSGSSVFAIFNTEEEQQRALTNFKAEAGWRIFSCRTLSRNKYLAAIDCA
ncbi:MAG: 4-(cytidine 5'-diphospho)-2-C-methyl-D-erythritol kinase [Pyrinomonadaceae bacterium]